MKATPIFDPKQARRAKAEFKSEVLAEYFILLLAQPHAHPDPRPRVLAR
jgi:hypothetical protein